MRTQRNMFQTATKKKTKVQKKTLMKQRQGMLKTMVMKMLTRPGEEWMDTARTPTG